MKKWLTLIEVMFSIAIFGVWAVYVLSSLIDNISFFERTNLRNEATFLAKEGIEIAYNIVDSNINRWMAWNCLGYNVNYNCTEKIWDSNNYYKFSIDKDWYFNTSITNKDFDDNIIYYHTWTSDLFWYNHDDTWQETYFSRYLYFTWVYSQGDSWIIDKNKILKVNSIVEYKKWAFTWEVILESFIWNVR